MDRFFLSSGQPDPAKTTTVVGIPLPRHSSSGASQIREAVSKILSLCQETGFGPGTQKIFLGWDRAAVIKGTGDHADTEAKNLQDADEEREAEPAEMHINYIIDYDKIEEECLDQTDDLSLDIRQIENLDTFQADFDFGILEGVMIISVKADVLSRNCSELDREVDSNDESDKNQENDDEDEDDGAEYGIKPIKATKRKADGPERRGHPQRRPR